ncbi:hypothetical protein IFM89_023389 [Coptis chinensis]|uniref:FAS1 domain-containing protein n=1 Tax=Coptis chinensis TaxID=261450 RepID=A0A835I0Z8_9MAGN|nr:hypothetical protein IFM89_023389 [Coptis chinensis]
MASSPSLLAFCLLLFFIIFFSLFTKTSSIPESELQLSLAALRSKGYNLFGNAITISDIHYQLLNTSSNSTYTFFAPKDSSLFSLDMVAPASLYVSTLRYHVVLGRYSFSDLQALGSSNSTLPTLLNDHEVGISSNSDQKMNESGDVGMITVDDIDVVVPGLFVSQNLAVHGLNGILDHRLRNGSTSKHQEFEEMNVSISFNNPSPAPAPVLDGMPPESHDISPFSPMSLSPEFLAPVTSSMSPSEYGSFSPTEVPMVNAPEAHLGEMPIEFHDILFLPPVISGMPTLPPTSSDMSVFDQRMEKVSARRNVPINKVSLSPESEAGMGRIALAFHGTPSLPPEFHNMPSMPPEIVAPVMNSVDVMPPESQEMSLFPMEFHDTTLFPPEMSVPVMNMPPESQEMSLFPMEFSDTTSLPPEMSVPVMNMPPESQEMSLFPMEFRDVASLPPEISVPVMNMPPEYNFPALSPAEVPMFHAPVPGPVNNFDGLSWSGLETGLGKGVGGTTKSGPRVKGRRANELDLLAIAPVHFWSSTGIAVNGRDLWHLEFCKASVSSRCI